MWVGGGGVIYIANIVLNLYSCWHPLLTIIISLSLHSYLNLFFDLHLGLLYCWFLCRLFSLFLDWFCLFFNGFFRLLLDLFSKIDVLADKLPRCWIRTLLLCLSALGDSATSTLGTRLPKTSVIINVGEWSSRVLSRASFVTEGVTSSLRSRGGGDCWVVGIGIPFLSTCKKIAEYN